MKKNARTGPSSRPASAQSAAVRDVMRATDMVIHPDHAIDEALARLRDDGLKFAPVADSDEIVGIITFDALLAKPDALDAVDAPAVRDRMTTRIPFVYDDDPLGLVLAVERSTGCSTFCVVDRRHRLVGLLEVDEATRKRAAAQEIPDLPERVRARVAVTASRATASPPGSVPAFADTPTLYLHPRARAKGNESGDAGC